MGYRLPQPFPEGPVGPTSEVSQVNGKTLPMAVQCTEWIVYSGGHMTWRDFSDFPELDSNTAQRLYLCHCLIGKVKG